MATVNHPLFSMNGGACTGSYDYDDQTLLILAFHVVNNDTRSYQISATSTATAKNHSFTIPANSSINQNVTPGVQNRLQLSVGPGGKLDGVEWSIF